MDPGQEVDANVTADSRSLVAARCATVRICDSRGSHRGQGLRILVPDAGQVVLTCHHVLAVLSPEDLFVAIADAEGEVGTPIRAHYDSDHSHPANDVAVLRLDSAAGPDRSPPKLYALDNAGNFQGSLRVTGLTLMSPNQFTADLRTSTSVRIPTRASPAWPDSPSEYFIRSAFVLAGATDSREGISGAPIFCGDGVLGLTHFAREESSRAAREVYAAPLTSWAVDWPELRQLMDPYQPESNGGAAWRSAVRRDEDRSYALEQSRRFWIEGVRDKSLYAQAPLILNFDRRPDAVDRPLNAVFQIRNEPPQPFAPGTPITNIFKQSGNALLILGTPGTGKTTLMCDLLDELLKVAVRDSSARIPVMVKLASWAAERRPLGKWLEHELRDRGIAARPIARNWIHSNNLALLLDGLDEVTEEHQKECVDAINTFRRDHPTVPLAVSSRLVEFEGIGRPLSLSDAVIVQPLMEQQVEATLQQVGSGALRLLADSRGDPRLRQLLSTPLMLWIAILAYGREYNAPLSANGDARRQLFARFVGSMLLWRNSGKQYTKEQTERWLRTLAAWLLRRRIPQFSFEELDTDFLPRARERWFTRGLMVFGMAAASGVLMCFLSLFDDAIDVSNSQNIVTLLAWFAVWGLTAALWRPSPVEGVRLSVKGLSTRVKTAALTGIQVGGAVGIVVIVGVWTDLQGRSPVTFVVQSLFIMLASILFGGFAAACLRVLLVESAQSRGKPNQGTRRSAIAALIATAFVFLVGIVTFHRDLSSLPIFMLIVTPPVGGLFGGFFVLRNWCVRLAVWISREGPFRYVRFVDFAADRLILNKLGGSYQFTHQLLLEHMASVRPEVASVSRQTVVQRLPLKARRLLKSIILLGALAAVGALAIGYRDRVAIRLRQFTGVIAPKSIGYLDMTMQLFERSAPMPQSRYVRDIVEFPDSARVALVASWGWDPNRAGLLLQRVARKRPDVIVCLGNPFPKGRFADPASDFLAPLTRSLDLTRTKTRVLVVASRSNWDRQPLQSEWLLNRLGQRSAVFSLRNNSSQFDIVDYFGDSPSQAVRTLNQSIFGKGARHEIGLASFDGLSHSAYPTGFPPLFQLPVYAKTFPDSLSAMFVRGEFLYKEDPFISIGLPDPPIPNDETPGYPILTKKGHTFYDQTYVILTFNPASVQGDYYDFDPDTGIETVMLSEADIFE